MMGRVGGETRSTERAVRRVTKKMKCPTELPRRIDGVWYLWRPEEKKALDFPQSRSQRWL